MSHFVQSIFKKNRAVYTVIALFIFFINWWVLFFILHVSLYEIVWEMSYQCIALYGALYGLFFANKRAINKEEKRIVTIFSFGLLFQCIGQSVFGFYILYTNVPLPYPSFADLGFFGSTLLYLAGTILFYHADKSAKLKLSIEKFQGILIFFVLYVLSYIFFLQGYYIDLSQPLKLLLDLGYPLVQATYMGFAIILSYSSKYARLFLPALTMQYFADFNFLFQANQGTWNLHGYYDIIYLSAYVLMTLAIIQIVRRI